MQRRVAIRKITYSTQRSARLMARRRRRHAVNGAGEKLIPASDKSQSTIAAVKASMRV
jgi:hypothetical protein